MKISKPISLLLETIGLVRPVVIPAAPLFEEENEEDEILAFQKHRQAQREPYRFVLINIAQTA